MNFLTTAQAAKLTGYNQNHLNRLIRQGKIKAQKIGTAWAIDKESLLAYEPDLSTRFKAKPKRKNGSLFTSGSTMIRSKPTVTNGIVKQNLEKLNDIQQQAKTALYVDAKGNLIREVKRNE